MVGSLDLRPRPPQGLTKYYPSGYSVVNPQRGLKEPNMKEYWTTKRTAEQLGISKEWLLILARNRVTPHATIGTALGWDPERLEEVRAAIPAPSTHAK